TTGLQKQVASLNQSLAQKEQGVKNASCQRCSSVIETFEKYKASHQQIVAKQETKIELLEKRLLAFDKDQRERSATSRHGSSASAVHRNFFSLMDESKLQEEEGGSVLVWESEEESPASSSRNLVPPSPLQPRQRIAHCASPSLRARTSPNHACERSPAPPQKSPSLLANVNMLPAANVKAERCVETTKADGLAKNIKTERPTDDVSRCTSDASRDFKLPAADPVPTPPRVRCATKPAVDNPTAAHPVASPRSLSPPLHSSVSSRQPSTVGLPRKEAVLVEPAPKSAGERDDDPSQSLLKPLASVCAPKLKQSPSGMSGDEIAADRVSVDLTLSTQESDRSPSEASTSESAPVKLPLAGKRLFSGGECRGGPEQAAASCKPSPPRKRKKQTKLSDRYFLSVNRHSLFTRNLARRRELSQTKLGRRSGAESSLEPREDLDDTYLPSLEIADKPAPDAVPLSDDLPVPDVLPRRTEAVRDNGKEKLVPASGSSSDAPEVAHKYHGSPVRGREARLRLPAHDCKDCQDFYERAGRGRRRELLKKCSRHRALHAPPPTPDNFWELDFPDTEECKARGYLNETLNDTPK
ncbi:unnamed protein product, partial [Ixodes hexagonus]